MPQTINKFQEEINKGGEATGKVIQRVGKNYKEVNPQVEKQDHIWSLREFRTNAYLETVVVKTKPPSHPPKNKT